MQTTSLVIGIVTELAVVYTSIDIATTDASFLSILGGTLFFLAGTFLTWKAFSGPEDTTKFN